LNSFPNGKLFLLNTLQKLEVFGTIEVPLFSSLNWFGYWKNLRIIEKGFAGPARVNSTRPEMFSTGQQSTLSMTCTPAPDHHVRMGSVSTGQPLLPVLTARASMPNGHRQAHVTAVLIFVACELESQKTMLSLLSVPHLSLYSSPLLRTLSQATFPPPDEQHQARDLTSTFAPLLPISRAPRHLQLHHSGRFFCCKEGSPLPGISGHGAAPPLPP
jgi:hypothetical protein